MIPGEMFLREEPIILNEDRESIEIIVTNIGDRPVQVGSHYHFFEVNRCLRFERGKAFGMHLDIPSGTSIRFEPGEQKTVNLVEIRGNRCYLGFNALTMGKTDEINYETAMQKLTAGEFATEGDE